MKINVKKENNIISIEINNGLPDCVLYRFDGCVAAIYYEQFNKYLILTKNRDKVAKIVYLLHKFYEKDAKYVLNMFKKTFKIFT